MASREEAREIRAALGGLPADQRRVIELAYFGGFTHSEIADMLDLPSGTVKGRMRLGLAKLRLALGDRGRGRRDEQTRLDVRRLAIAVVTPPRTCSARSIASEAEDFRRHLNSCVVCRDEVAAFGHVVDALADGSATAVRAPRVCARRVMRDVRMDADLGWRGRAAVSWPPTALGPLASSVPPSPAGVRGGGDARDRRSVSSCAPGGSDGTRLIRAAVTAVPGNAQLRVAGRPRRADRNSPAVHRRRAASTSCGSNAADQAPSPTSALFSVTTSGAADVGVPGDVRGVNTIMVTQEPAGGSLVPTRAPVIVAQLT